MDLQHRLTKGDLKTIQAFLTSSHKITDPRVSEDIAKEIIRSEQNGYDINKVSTLSELDLSKVSTQGSRIRIIVADNGSYIVATGADNLSSLSEKRQLAEDHVLRIRQLETFPSSSDAKNIAEKFIKQADSPEQIKEGLMLKDADLLATDRKFSNSYDLNNWSALPSIQRHLDIPSLSGLYYGKDLECLLKIAIKRQPSSISIALLKMPLGCLWS